eukprot:TRINITY_DN17777_c1_g1_i1.p1 TRINITY_DN17777_c1_g1~~TRINITY_DN17777_c1_g1_i1.p1  ORF type:complete len:455 (-),score=35.28 TRINITY_DN17777_c1_g1_i1:262-1626(-)
MNLNQVCGGHKIKQCIRKQFQTPKHIKIQRGRKTMELKSMSVPIEALIAIGAVSISAVTVAGLLWLNSSNKKVEVHYNPTPSNQEIVDRLSQSLHPERIYPAIWWLTNGHIETVFANFTRKSPQVKYVRELVPMSDGGLVALDWKYPFQESMIRDTPIVLLLPGLTGGSHDNYIQYMVQQAQQNGMCAVVVNGRGTANSPVVTPQFYSASFTGDIREVVQHVVRKQTMANGGNGTAPQVCAIGWSLGANILVNYLGEEGQDCPLTCAVSMCNPFNLTECDKNFRNGINFVYDWRLGTGLAKIFGEHQELFRNREDLDIQLALNSKTVRDFDEAITRRVFGWPTVDHYYAGSCSCNALPNVRIPLLCVQAQDDPIAIKQSIPYDEVNANDNCILYVTPYGGHLGWIAGQNAPFGAPWPDQLVINYLQFIFNERSREKLADFQLENGRVEIKSGII